MSVDGGKSSFSNWDKISEKIINTDYPDFNKAAEFFDKINKSTIQVMKDEIKDDENNHFIVENAQLKELLKRCLEHFQDERFEKMPEEDFVERCDIMREIEEKLK